MLVAPNDLLVLSNLAAVPAVVHLASFGNVLLAGTLGFAAVASALFHAAETTKHDLGSHGLAGSPWAKGLSNNEVTLLWIDRAAAFVAVVLTSNRVGGVPELICKLSGSAWLMASVFVALTCLCVSEVSTGWTYALWHSAWHVLVFSLPRHLIGASATMRDGVDLLVVGLGNHGLQYRKTRHNLGMEVVERLALRLDVGPLKPASQLQSRIAQFDHAGKSVMLACPVTFMNRSGRAVSALCQACGLKEGQKLLIVHDDLDLAPGRLKLKLGGGEAGHNGLRSIVACLGTNGFARLRLGVGKPPKGLGPVWVLSGAGNEETMQIFQEVTELGSDAILSWIEGGLEVAMNAFNGATCTSSSHDGTAEGKGRPSGTCIMDSCSIVEVKPVISMQKACICPLHVKSTTLTQVTK